MCISIECNRTRLEFVYVPVLREPQRKMLFGELNKFLFTTKYALSLIIHTIVDDTSSFHGIACFMLH